MLSYFEPTLNAEHAKLAKHVSLRASRPLRSFKGDDVAASRPGLAREVPSVVSVRQANPVLPAQGKPGNPPPDRRRVSGVQRRPSLRSVAGLRREDAEAGERHDDWPD